MSFKTEDSNRSRGYMGLGPAAIVVAVLFACSSPPVQKKPVSKVYPQSGPAIVDGLVAKKVLSTLGAKMLRAEIEKAQNLDRQRLDILEFLYQAFYNEYVYRLKGSGADLERSIVAQDPEVFFDWRAYSIIRGRSRLFGYQSIIHEQCSVTGKTRSRTLKALCDLGLCPQDPVNQQRLFQRLESEIANEVVMTAVLMKLKKRELGTADAPPKIEKNP